MTVSEHADESVSRRTRRSLVFWLTMTLGLTARLGAEMAMEARALDIAWFTLLLAGSVSRAFDAVMGALRHRHARAFEDLPEVPG